MITNLNQSRRDNTRYVYPTLLYEKEKQSFSNVIRVQRYNDYFVVVTTHVSWMTKMIWRLNNYCPAIVLCVNVKRVKNCLQTLKLAKGTKKKLFLSVLVSLGPTVSTRLFLCTSQFIFETTFLQKKYSHCVKWSDRLRTCSSSCNGESSPLRRMKINKQIVYVACIYVLIRT